MTGVFLQFDKQRAAVSRQDETVESPFVDHPPDAVQ